MNNCHRDYAQQNAKELAALLTKKTASHTSSDRLSES